MGMLDYIVNIIMLVLFFGGTSFLLLLLEKKKQEAIEAEQEGKKMKSKTTALILSIFVGVLGIDRFYLGYTGMGVLKLLTGGVFGILYIIDIITIATGSLTPADGSQYEEDCQKQNMMQAVPASNVYDDLQKVANLHNQGVLTDAEFEKLKAELMQKM